MATASLPTERPMSVAGFLAWSEGLGREERYELVRGVPVQLMAPTIIRHARVQRNVAEALRRVLSMAGLRCEVFENGPGLALGEEGDECRMPDVVVTCATEIDETARLVPDPLIVVEVASPSTRLTDVNDKVEFYGRIASIQHYLVIEQDRRRLVHYGRGAGGELEPRILRTGSIPLAAPGLELEMDVIYAGTALAVG